MKYFKVTCKCGHVGRFNYIPISFAVIAENGKEASSKARQIPRVKHHQKKAILSCNEISYEEYRNLIEQNSENKYLKCRNIQQQRKECDLKDKIVKDDERIQICKKDKSSRINRLHYLKKKFDEIDKVIVEILKDETMYETSDSD